MRYQVTVRIETDIPADILPDRRLERNTIVEIPHTWGDGSLRGRVEDVAVPQPGTRDNTHTPPTGQEDARTMTERHAIYEAIDTVGIACLEQHEVVQRAGLQRLVTLMARATPAPAPQGG